MPFAMITKGQLSVASVLALIAATMFVVQPALAAPQGACEAVGGSWDGVDANNGTCTFGEGSDVAVDLCDSDYAYYKETYTAGTLDSSKCTYTRGFGGQGDTTDNKDATKSVTLKLNGGKNGTATLPASLCKPQCTITATLPQSAKNALPSGTLAKMYVRVPSSASSYLVCFKNTTGASVSIYRFVGIAWVRIATSSGATICASNFGSGAYSLQ